MSGAESDAGTGAARSQAWYAGDSRDAFIHRAWMRRGLPDHAFDGRPQIVICNTWSDLTPCNGHFREIAEHVKRGVWEAGGVPLEMPVPSLGETLVRPTAMYFRDLAAMVVEELIRANPVDGVVLLGGCDKTVPSLIMGAASVDLPTLMVTGGPMLNGSWNGRPLGCGTGVWEMSEEVRAGRMPRADLRRAESAMIHSRGHCNTMGTASTMACVAESLGMTLPGNAGLPAPDSRLLELAHGAGNRIVAMVAEDLRPERDPDRRGDPQRRSHRRRGRRLHQRCGSSARHRRPRRCVRHARRHRRRRTRHPVAGRHPARGRAPDGGLLPGGGPRRGARADRGAPGARSDRVRVPVDRSDQRRAAPRARRHPARGGPDRSRGGDRRAARQPVPGRGRGQAGRRHAGAAAPPRTRRGVRRCRGPARPCRRPRPRRRADRRARAAWLRPARLPRAARGGQHAPARQGPRRRRARHGADQ